MRNDGWHVTRARIIQQALNFSFDTVTHDADLYIDSSRKKANAGSHRKLIRLDGAIDEQLATRTKGIKAKARRAHKAPGSSRESEKECWAVGC